MSKVSGKQSLRAVYALIGNRTSRNSLRIYEAGGGSASCLSAEILKDSDVTVVDIDQSQLERNAYANEKILGDIQKAAFPENSFDLIVCYNVIEHLDAPDEAFKRFYEALAPGGLLFIGAPNPISFSGWVTKVTPHWFHVMYYKRVLGYKFAGQPGRTPFKTVFRPVVTPAKLIAYCRNLGFNVLYSCEYQGMVYANMAERRPLLAKLLNVSILLANAFVLWRRDLRDGDYHIVLEKRPLASKVNNGSALN